MWAASNKCESTWRTGTIGFHIIVFTFGMQIFTFTFASVFVLKSGIPELKPSTQSSGSGSSSGDTLGQLHAISGLVDSFIQCPVSGSQSAVLGSNLGNKAVGSNQVTQQDSPNSERSESSERTKQKREKKQERGNRSTSAGAPMSREEASPARRGDQTRATDTDTHLIQSLPSQSPMYLHREL